MRWLGKSWLCVTLLLGLLNVELVLAQSETWRGLVVAPERRCSPYNRQRDYQYSQSIELDIIEGLGAVYSPYTGTCFNSRGETDIEHMVAASEAHDSGLCAADRATRRRFANDTRNLTLASPQVNRYQKSDKDAADWMPQRNKCWFAARVVAVRRAYNLTIDRREANALERVLSNCSSTAMAPISCQTRSVVLPRRSGTGESGPLELYDDNDNGRITCAEARAHGIAPVRRTHPAYRYMRDGDGDGVVCE
ncbi:MAG: excalibur calcium-binding domain-containing protein [Gammaproteobacteria bacterium]|nr:excalibur calcium-binding domain-containing protein [Gammaproteobacteria bacterium]